MEISIEDLLAFVTQAVDTGIQDYLRSIEPASDRINQAEAKKYLKKRGVEPARLQDWSKKGLLRPVKTGDRQNARVLYSLAEIKRAIMTENIGRIYNNQKPIKHERANSNSIDAERPQGAVQHIRKISIPLV